MLQSLFFSLNHPSPRVEHIPTVISTLGRSPCIDAAIPTQRDAPWTKVLTDVRDGRRRKLTFAIFFRSHPNWPSNACLMRVASSLCYSGEVVILKVGKHAEFVNLKTSDRRFALNAVKRYQLLTLSRIVADIRGVDQGQCRQFRRLGSADD